MHLSRLLMPTLREDPAEAEVVSHRLLVRAGMIRQVARGIYEFLPLGLRVMRKVERIVREEMDGAGAQEILLPAVCPAELWRESGRWDLYGKELLRLKDRHEREFCFGPTHEEVVTDIIRREIRSYRELPLNLYQIQVKFRDEVRPRFGLMRGREFIMKDGYSFHTDRADCDREYENMFNAYGRIFKRCGLRYRAVEADTGAIGGSRSHEFQVLADSGEDAIVSCDQCDYAANVEKAGIANRDPAPAADRTATLSKVYTPAKRTVEEVAQFLGRPLQSFVKTLLYTLDTGETIAVLVRGDHAVSEAKLKDYLGCAGVLLAEAEKVEELTGAEVGFAGPVGLSVRLVADLALVGVTDAVSGANERNYHLSGIDQARDFSSAEFADLRMATSGDHCSRCDTGRLTLQRGIEVGQVFYLGTKYSRPLKATYLDASGREQPIEMGTYGIGITRTMAASVEQNHDAGGIVWPMPIAPFHVIVLPVNWNDEKMREAAEGLYRQLGEAGIEVLLDDRQERPGVKFKDADLIGVPLRVTIGKKSLARGAVELKARKAPAVEEIPLADAAERICDLVATGAKG